LWLSVTITQNEAPAARHFLQSSLREKLLEHVFIGKLLQCLWRKGRCAATPTQCEEAHATDRTSAGRLGLGPQIPLDSPTHTLLGNPYDSAQPGTCAGDKIGRAISA
jgi:hypothetical protein